MLETVNGEDRLATVGRFLRETDDPGVYTVNWGDRTMTWVRWDGERKQYVRSYGQKDGEPVPRWEGARYEADVRAVQDAAREAPEPEAEEVAD